MDSSSGHIKNRLQGLDLSREFHGEAQSPLPHLPDLRAKGNQLFQQGDWKGAISCYSECIEEATGVFVNCYSNRAEAWLKLEEYGKAVTDCEKALELDSTHLKSLFRKGRALQGLREYNLACSCFRLALEKSPDANEMIKLHMDKSKKLDEENKQGKFDLSAYFQNGLRRQDIPEVGNYIGPVIIKKSPVHGRGLFATKDVEIGDTLLVDNAIAMSRMYTRPVAFRVEESPVSELQSLHQDTVEQAATRAMLCPRILRQLQLLTDSSWPKETEVPDMDLFRVNNGNWNKFGEIPENLQIKTFKLGKAMELNGVLTHISRSEENPVVKDEIDVDSSIGFCNQSVIEQCGLWGLPSFINHSCFPNAKRMVVGNAMFIIAVRGIAAQEEITVPYSRSLLPLLERERDLTPLGFRCECKRCVLERSLDPSFRKLSYTINNHWQSLTKPTNISSRNLQSIIRFALQLENIELQDEVLKQLIRASYYCLYKFVFVGAKVYTDVRVLSQSLPSIMEVAEALSHADPGSGASLQMVQMLLEEAHGKKRDLHLQKAIEYSIAIIGKQKEDVHKAFVVSKFNNRTPTVRTWNPREVYSTINI